MTGARRGKRRASMRVSPRSASSSARMSGPRFRGFRFDEGAVEEFLGDLDGVKGGALAQVVRDAPEGEAVLDRLVGANAADIGRPFADAFLRRDELVFG